MAKPLIAFDLDDVLAHSTESFRIRVNELTGAELTREHYAVPGEYWGYLPGVWKANGILDKVPTDELFGKMQESQLHIPAHPGAQQVLKKLAKQYDLVVVTAREAPLERATHVWLQHYYPDTFSNLVLGGGKHDPTGRTKADICLELGASYLVDDNVEHCVHADAAGLHAVLFGDYGWHFGQKVPATVTRATDWIAVQEYFDAAGHRP